VAELGSGNGTGYPGTLDTDNVLEVDSPSASKTKARANVPNDMGAAIVAIQKELGTDPAGTATDVKTRLAAEHNNDGTHSDITASSATVSGNIIGALSIRDVSRDLIIKNNAGTPNSQVDVDADEVVLQDTNGYAKRIASINLTLDLTASGINGLDTGSEAGNTWYYIWILNGSSGTGGVLSTATAFGSVTKPSGYDTYGALVGAMLNDNSSNFVTLYQLGKRARSITGNIGSLTQTTATSLTLNDGNADLVPDTAKYLYGHVTNSSSERTNYFHPVTFTPGVGTVWSHIRLGSQGSAGLPFECPIETAKTIFYAVSASTATIYVQGWEY
jgi:hypothetical protein